MKLDKTLIAASVAAAFCLAAGSALATNTAITDQSGSTNSLATQNQTGGVNNMADIDQTDSSDNEAVQSQQGVMLTKLSSSKLMVGAKITMRSRTRREAATWQPFVSQHRRLLVQQIMFPIKRRLETITKPLLM